MTDFHLWLFPVLFILHDFEEIIFIRAWVARNQEFLSAKFPGLANRLLQHVEALGTEGFSLAVAEEFIVISGVTVIAVLNAGQFLWNCLFFAFSLHLFLHIGQGLVLRRYVPGLVTSLLMLPLCLTITRKVLAFGDYTTPELLSSAGFGVLLTAGNLWLIHRLGVWFSNWLRVYSGTRG